MSRNFETFLILILFVFTSTGESSAQAPSWAWAKQAGGPSIDKGTAVTTDINGNVYIAGGFYSPSISFNTITVNRTGAGQNFYIAKYDPSGNILWVRHSAGNDWDIATGLCSDDIGNVYVTGTFTSDTISFGNFALINTNPVGPLRDIFIAKCDASGNIIWLKGAGGTGEDYTTQIAADAANNIYVTGSFASNSISLGSTVLTNNTTNGSEDIFIAKYDSFGNVLWAKSAGGNKNDNSGGISLDGNSNIYIAGSFSSAGINFGSTHFTNDTVDGTFDIFVVKYDSSGSIIWARQSGGSSDDNVQSISTDVNGNSYIIGYFGGSISFDTVLLTFTISNFFIAKYDSSGTAIWAKSNFRRFICHDIFTDGLGNIYVSGGMLDSIAIPNVPYTDIFIVKYDSAGNVIYSNRIGGSLNIAINPGNRGLSVTADRDNNIFITGFFVDPTITFGNIVLTNTDTNYFQDIFLAKLDDVTGISENRTFPEASIVFPNPNHGHFNIASSGRIRKVKITNLYGQIVKEVEPAENNLSLEIYQTGIYFVQVITARQTEVKKIIVCR